VVDARTGTPLAGAVVVHLDRPAELVRTDADGSFSIDAPRKGRVAAFGRDRGWRSYPVPRAGDVELRLAEARPVRGRVVGPDGAGVEGARVTAVAVNAEGASEPVRGPLTGPDGRFDLSWAPRPHRGSGSSVHVSAYRRGLGRSPAIVVAEGADVELRLGGERTIAGSVVREEGVPCAGVDVMVRTDAGDVPPLVSQFLGLEQQVLCRTDAEGRFSAAGLPADVAVDVDFVVDTVRIERRSEPGDAGPLDILIPRGRSITGRVVDVDGQPVTLGGEARAEMLNNPELRRLVRTAPIGPDGTFRIDDLPDGTYGVRARIRTFQVNGAVAEAGDEGVELVAERPADLEVELVFPEGAERRPIDVQLLDATDPAVPPRVEHVDPDATGARGVFELVRHGRYHLIAAGGPWRCRMRDVDVADGRRPAVRMVLERTLVRSLVVEAPDGTPLPGRRVIVAPVGMRGVNPEQFFTGEGGTAEIAGLAEGRWIARVVAEGHPLLEERFTVSPDDAGEIRMRYPQHGELEVVVDREALGDAQGAVVSLTDAEGRPLNAWGPGAREMASRWRLPAAGPLLLKGVVAGTVTVTLSAADGGTTSRETEVEGGGRASVRLP